MTETGENYQKLIKKDKLPVSRHSRTFLGTGNLAELPILESRRLRIFGGFDFLITLNTTNVIFCSLKAFFVSSSGFLH